MTGDEIPYVAGIVDLVGRFSTFRTPGGTELPALNINMNNPELMSYLGETSGIQPFVTRRKYDKHTCAEHCQQAHTHVNSESMRWSVSGAKATIIIGALLPHLKLQWPVAYRTFKLGVTAHKKPATLTKMSAIGWPMPSEWT